MSDSAENPFAQAMQGVKPLAQGSVRDRLRRNDPTLAQQLKRNALEKESNQSLHSLSLELIEAIDPHDPLDYKQDGIQHGVYKNLRLGKYQIDTTVNLHTGNIELARESLLENIAASHASGVRCLLLRFGPSKPNAKAAKLKSYLQQWLKLIPEVIAYHSAIAQHGGIGAAYVLLKKNNEQKLENREIHRKRYPKVRYSLFKRYYSVNWQCAWAC